MTEEKDREVCEEWEGVKVWDEGKLVDLRQVRQYGNGDGVAHSGIVAATCRIVGRRGERT